MMGEVEGLIRSASYASANTLGREDVGSVHDVNEKN